MTWRRIRLELARSPEFVNGSAEHGYVIVAPLDEAGRLDEPAWRAEKARARVRRFWREEDDELGHLIHTRHRTWAFSYAPGEDDDEPIFHLETHSLSPGEYVSVTEHDGETRTFRVVAAPALEGG